MIDEHFLTKAICDDDVSRGSLLVFLSREKKMGCGSLRPSVDRDFSQTPSLLQSQRGTHPQFQSVYPLWMCSSIPRSFILSWIVYIDSLTCASLLMVSDGQSLRANPPYLLGARPCFSVCINLKIIHCNVKLLPNGCVNPCPFVDGE